MKIGSLELSGSVILAPLAGVTSLPFRVVVKECGCALVCSEMISAKGIVYNSGKTRSMLASVPEERPVSFQIFGACPVSMARAAAFIEKETVADVIDINFGCSVRKVVKTGAGAALMKDPETARSVICSVREAVSLPLTIKIRSGWDSSGTQALRISEIAQMHGVDALILHARTALQGFGGRVDLDLIKRVKKHVSIPVIGNGDILTPEDGVRMAGETGCDGVMVGRGALGNPYLPSQIQSLFDGRPVKEVDREDIFNIMERVVKAYVEHFGDERGSRMLRSRLVWFVKGFPGANNFRKKIVRIESPSQAIALIRRFSAAGDDNASS